MQRKQEPILLEKSTRLKSKNTPIDWVDEVDGVDWVDVAHRYAMFLCSLDGEYQKKKEEKNSWGRAGQSKVVQEVLADLKIW